MDGCLVYQHIFITVLNTVLCIYAYDIHLNNQSMAYGICITYGIAEWMDDRGFSDPSNSISDTSSQWLIE